MFEKWLDAKCSGIWMPFEYRKAQPFEYWTMEAILSSNWMVGLGHSTSRPFEYQTIWYSNGWYWDPHLYITPKKLIVDFLHLQNYLITSNFKNLNLGELKLKSSREYGIMVGFKSLSDEPLNVNRGKGFFEITCVSDMYETYVKGDLSDMNQVSFFPVTALLEDDVRLNFRFIQNCWVMYNTQPSTWTFYNQNGSAFLLF